MTIGVQDMMHNVYNKHMWDMSVGVRDMNDSQRV